jgi:hypothetical protein
MALRLGDVIHHLVDNSQAAFQKQKRASDVARLVQDLIDHCEDQDLEGFIVFCDQHKAYDRVSWSFMQKVLEAMNLPTEFSQLTNLLYTDSQTRMKVNGHIGEPQQTSNGVRQGCGLSPLLYLLVFQSLLSLINTSHLFNDPDIPSYEGVDLPSPTPLSTTPKRVKAAAYADDLTGFMRGASHMPAFKALVKIYEDGSLARLSWPKTYGLAFGKSRRDPLLQTHVETAGIKVDPATVIRLLGTYIGPATQVEAI